MSASPFLVGHQVITVGRLIVMDILSNLSISGGRAWNKWREYGRGEVIKKIRELKIRLGIVAT